MVYEDILDLPGLGTKNQEGFGLGVVHITIYIKLKFRI